MVTYDTIIFDLDDTIVDTFNLAKVRITKVLNDICSERGINKRFHEEDVVKKVGLPLTTMYDIFLKGTGVSYDDFYDRLKRTMNTIPKLIDGADETLRSLSKKYNLGMISSREKSIFTILDKYKISNLFSFIYHADNTRYHKPDKRLILDIIKREKLDIKKTLFVGDSIYDIKMCNDANVDIIHVKTGYYKNVDENKVIRSIESIKDIKKIL